MTFLASWIQHTALGPVLIELTPEHGVHAGDVIGTLPGIAAVILFGIILDRVRRQGA